MVAPGNGGGGRSRSRVDPAAEAAALVCIQRGEHPEALTILMQAYGAHILGFAAHMVRDAALGEDVRQQVFMEAFLGFDKFEGRGTLWSWLCTIARNRCLDVIRRRKPTVDVDDFSVSEALAGPPDPVMDPESVKERRELQHCLGKLPEIAREQVLMRSCLGMTNIEIGKASDELPGTVQVRTKRSLVKLRQWMRKRGVQR